jgi:hypothetical protein
MLMLLPEISEAGRAASSRKPPLPIVATSAPQNPPRSAQPCKTHCCNEKGEPKISLFAHRSNDLIEAVMYFCASSVIAVASLSPAFVCQAPSAGTNVQLDAQTKQKQWLSTQK